MIRRMYSVAFVALLALPAGAQAQQLLETDGIELHGTARVVTSAAGTCNVLEASHAAAEYERIQANHGQPLDVWQLDFSVRNGSGRWLDHLIALYGIEARRPDCTNWTGPTGTYTEPVQWTSTLGHIQETGRNVVAPEATRTATVFILALQGDPPPRFENWSVNFDFAAAPAAAGVGSSATATAPAQQAAAATPEQETVFWQSIEDSTNPTMFEAYLEQFPNGVFRALAQGRLAELRAPAGDAPVAGGARGGGAAAGRIASTPADAATRAGETRVFDGMEFVWVPAGEFQMGSTIAEASDWEQPVTQVRISRGFWLGQHEVTQAEWQGVMGSNPSYFDECGRSCPVEQVSWNDTQEFIGSLNARSGGNRYRLPTEAEWEYAARAGTTGDRYGNVDAIAWFIENSGDGPLPVGGKAANAWGLHDMLGNVWEWVEDWYGDYPGGVVTDPRGPGSGTLRVLRGGSWFDFGGVCRASVRFYLSPGERARGSGIQGFRLLRTE